MRISSLQCSGCRPERRHLSLEAVLDPPQSPLRFFPDPIIRKILPPRARARLPRRGELFLFSVLILLGRRIRRCLGRKTPLFPESGGVIAAVSSIGRATNSGAIDAVCGVGLAV